MSGYRGVSFQTQSMLRDAIDFAKKRRLDQDELERQRIEAAKYAADAWPNAQIQLEGMQIEADKDKAMEASVRDGYRRNDAFEVSAGRQSPELFNMRYGGVAAGGGGKSGGVAAGGGGGGAFNARLEAAKLATTKPMTDEMGKLIPGGFDQDSFDKIHKAIGGGPETQPTIQQDYFRNEQAKTDAINLLNGNDFSENVYQSQGQGGAPSFSMDKAMGATQGLDEYNQKKMERENYLTSFDGMPESQRTINMAPPAINPIRQALEWDKSAQQTPAAPVATNQSIVTPANRTGLVTDNDKGFLETPILESLSNLHSWVKGKREAGEEKRRKRTP